MDEDLKKQVIETTLEYMDQCFQDQEIASRLKAKFDEEQEPTWQCIVGRHFGSVVTHELKNYIYFYVG
jgi:dynein light chain LC8-type